MVHCWLGPFPGNSK